MQEMFSYHTWGLTSSAPRVFSELLNERVSLQWSFDNYLSLSLRRTFQYLEKCKTSCDLNLPNVAV